MNTDYFAVKEAPQVERVVVAKKNNNADDQGKQDFVSSYQAARKLQESRDEDARSSASRGRRDEVNRNNASREHRNRADSERANERRQEGVRNTAQAARKKSNETVTDRKDSGKPLPSKEGSGNAMQAHAAMTADRSPRVDPVETMDEKPLVQISQFQSYDLKSSEEATPSESVLLLEGEPDSESGVVSAEERNLSATLSRDGVTDQGRESSDEEMPNIESGLLSGTNEDDLDLTDQRVSLDESISVAGWKPEKAAEGSDIKISSSNLASSKSVADDGENNALKQDNREAANVEQRNTEMSSDEASGNVLKTNLEITEQIPAEKVTVTPLSLREQGEKSSRTGDANEKIKPTLVQPAIEPSAQKASADAHFREGLKGNSFDDQQSLLNTESAKADIKSSTAENLSASEMSLKEAKSGVATKGLDFSKALSAEKSPLRETIELPVSHKNWGEALAEKTALLVGQRGGFARLNLVPHNLGPLEIRVHLQGDSSSVEFIAVNPATKEAIESAIPKLREMFESGGLNLGDVNVNSQSKRDGSEERAQKFRNSESRDESNVELAESGVASPLSTSLLDGRVDFYA
ncbi:MAG: flagellar hook-length control protein FliK [Pseudomonadales bacterium]|nr:flagellar hook-length control protein FliK [Pseudomonadales bacterium]